MTNERLCPLHIGANILPQGGTHFRVWAPRRQAVEVVIEGGAERGSGSRTFELAPEGQGYFSGLGRSVGAGALYRFRLDGGDRLYPDPASRYQPEGPHGPSQVVDPKGFGWTDHDWRGVNLRGQVIYEMHIGTFTREGSWATAARELDELARLGITVVEVMPVADFPGKFGWGYDGVNLYAPTRLYGSPDDFRRFVDRAHAVGLGVILDVVYNHLGPDGNYLREFAQDYFTERYTTDWGAAINFGGENAGPVREYFIANAGYWIDEFHLDGLRLDATQNIYDLSDDHILAAVTRRARSSARGRSIIIVAENESQEAILVRPPEQGGYGIDALWNDDFHHSAMVAMTGRNEAYYTDYLGKPQEFISAVKYGYLYQGQWYRWQEWRRGTPSLKIPRTAFVNFIQNHDQVANSGRGERCHQLTGPGRYRAMTALTLLAHGTPMLFQGQEFAASSPFLFFADHNEKLAPLVRKGRAEFLAQFSSLATPEVQAILDDPGDERTFKRSKLDLSERERHSAIYEMHRDLLRLRREDAVFGGAAGGVDGAVLGDEAFVLRFFGEQDDDRLLLVNLGLDLNLNPAPEPLLAPPDGKEWRVLWSSEDPRYGGMGAPPPDSEERWFLPGCAAIALGPAPTPEDKILAARRRMEAVWRGQYRPGKRAVYPQRR
ncbi:MAG TPA: malto-oligosyltrehalose trehalohydrolase [Blastocatellia bacterium]|nr:malto-oligosyltrehalose trehalohydrolase [Blastocatellia bacterium]